jgi:hypothetical protein
VKALAFKNRAQVCEVNYGAEIGANVDRLLIVLDACKALGADLVEIEGRQFIITKDTYRETRE